MRQLNLRRCCQNNFNPGHDNNGPEATIDRMVDDVSTAIDDYDDNKISFEIGGRYYDDLNEMGEVK